jgi:hypothetical protein
MEVSFPYALVRRAGSRHLFLILNGSQVWAVEKRMSVERRRFVRPEALNLLDYLVVDAQGRQGEYSMARTLNVSKGGILMETHIPLPVGQQVMITLGLKENLVDVMGRIVYAIYSGGMHQNGIEFFHVAENDRRILEVYTEAFHKSYKESKAGLDHV